MKVVIHIGMHKAASTSIGVFITSNKEVLERHGVIVPHFGRRNLGHRKVVYDVFDFTGYTPLRGYDESRHEKRWMRQFQEIYAKNSDKLNSKLMILSSETFESYARNLQKFSKLLDWLSSFASNIEFVVVIRDQASFINSVYCQGAKGLKLVHDFEDDLQRILRKNSLDYGKRYSALFETGQKVKAVPFSRLVGEGIDKVVIGDVFGVEDTGIYDKIVLPPKQNTNPGTKAVAASLRIRRSIEEKLNGKSFPEEVRHAMRIAFVKRTRELGWDATSFSALDNKLATSIMKKFARKNDAFAKRVWGANWSEVYELPKFFHRSFEFDSASREEQEEFRDVVRSMGEMFDQLMKEFGGRDQQRQRSKATVLT